MATATFTLTAGGISYPGVSDYAGYDSTQPPLYSGTISAQPFPATTTLVALNTGTFFGSPSHYLTLAGNMTAYGTPTLTVNGSPWTVGAGSYNSGQDQTTYTLTSVGSGFAYGNSYTIVMTLNIPVSTVKDYETSDINVYGTSTDLQKDVAANTIKTNVLYTNTLKANNITTAGPYVSVNTSVISLGNNVGISVNTSYGQNKQALTLNSSGVPSYSNVNVSSQYTLIANVAVANTPSQAIINFTNIPDTFDELVIEFNEVSLENGGNYPAQYIDINGSFANSANNVQVWRVNNDSNPPYENCKFYGTLNIFGYNSTSRVMTIYPCATLSGYKFSDPFYLNPSYESYRIASYNMDKISVGSNYHKGMYTNLNSLSLYIRTGYLSLSGSVALWGK